MTVIEEKHYLNEISRLASKISYLESQISEAKKKFAYIKDAVDKHIAIDAYGDGVIQGCQNVLEMFSKWITRNTEKLGEEQP
jgi:hypothetical protein